MKVLLADKFEQEGVAALEAAGCEVVSDPSLKEDALITALAETGCDVLVVRSTKVQAPMFDAATNLSLVIRAGAGYDTIDTAAAAERNIRVCNCPGKNSAAVAELALGLMLALDRRIVDNTVDLRNGRWAKKAYSKARGLKGRTLGVVGLGKIGYEIAKRAAAFDMNLIYTDIVDQKEMEKELGIVKKSFDEVIAEADVITLHVPGGAGTKHLIGSAELAKMKPTTFLINCSRGGVVDEKALAGAIESGKLGGAGLDVYEIEPDATAETFEDPVVQTARVYGTHHIGASTEQAQLAVAEEVVRIIKAKMAGNDLPNIVN